MGSCLFVRLPKPLRSADKSCLFEPKCLITRSACTAPSANFALVREKPLPFSLPFELSSFSFLLWPSFVDTTPHSILLSVEEEQEEDRHVVTEVSVHCITVSMRLLQLLGQSKEEKN